MLEFLIVGGTLKCISCGSALGELARFCANCGSRTVSTAHSNANENDGLESKEPWDKFPSEPSSLVELTNHSGGGLVSQIDESPKPGPHLVLACPVCVKDDQVQKVKTIIAAGTTWTSGIGAGTTLGGLGNLSNLALGTFFASTSTQLTDELSGMNIPNGWPVFLKEGLAAAGLAMLAGAVFVQLATASDNFLTGFVGTLMVWWLWLGIGALWGLWQKNKFESEVLGPVRQRWADCKARLNEARFCFRDGVLFDESTSGDSAHFISQVFAPVEQELQRLESEGIITRYS